MTLQSTGAISMQDINTELRPITSSATATICLNQTAVRSLLGRPTDQSIISMNDAYGKDIRGQPWCGGRIIAKSGTTTGTVWIVAPSSTQISGTYADINTAATNAQTTTGVTGWYIPDGNTAGQLNTPGYACRSYWDSYNATTYWSSTQRDTFSAYAQNFSDGSICAGITFCIPCIVCIPCIPCIAPTPGRPSRTGRPGRPLFFTRGSGPIPCIPCIPCIAPSPGRPSQTGTTAQTGSCGGNKTISYCVRAFKCVTF